MNTTIPKVGIYRLGVQLKHKEPSKSMYIDGRYYPDDERYIFSETATKFCFRDVLDIKKSTWAYPHTSFELASLKLDWFFVRDIKEKSSELLPYCSSDHRPVFVRF